MNVCFSCRVPYLFNIVTCSHFFCLHIYRFVEDMVKSLAAKRRRLAQSQQSHQPIQSVIQSSAPPPTTVPTLSPPHIESTAINQLLTLPHIESSGASQPTAVPPIESPASPQLAAPLHTTSPTPTPTPTDASAPIPGPTNSSTHTYESGTAQNRTLVRLRNNV